MNRLFTIAALCVLGCGGGAAAQSGPKDAASEKGLKCLDQARIDRVPLPDAPSRIDVSHIVVKYAGIRGAESVTRTREEACLRAEELREKLLAGAEWEKLYEEYSDTKDSVKGVNRGASMDSLEKKFGNAAFALKVDELSYVVETENGFHVIWRMK